MIWTFLIKFKSTQMGKVQIIIHMHKKAHTLDGKVSIDLIGSHLDDILSLEKPRTNIALLWQRSTTDDDLISRIDFVGALEEHVVIGRVRDEYAVIGVVRLDAQQNRASENRVAGVGEPLVSVDALCRLLLLLLVMLLILRLLML